MAKLAQEHQDRLKSIKDNVKTSYEYFQNNYSRYHEFMNFIFKSGLTSDDRATLQELGKPDIECSILEAYISRLRGEFANQSPSLSVRAAEGVPLKSLDDKFIQQIKTVESHLRAIFSESSNDGMEWKLYGDLLGGGFSVAEVYTDYISEMSLEQCIYIDRVFDPTLCGFDPLARASHKGDGRWCFQLFPKRKEEFKEEYPSIDLDRFNYTREIDGFSWSYQNNNEDIVMLCDFYEKRKKKTKIVQLSNGKIITKKEYEQLAELWLEHGIVEKIPEIIKSRYTMIETIVRYRLCGEEIISYDETDFKYLPLVFIDGNSVELRGERGNSDSEQMTRPFVYHAKGMQRVKNFALQTLTNEVENMEMSKWLAPLESIPKDYSETWKDPQSASILVYNAYKEGSDQTVQLPAPREVNRIPTPPAVAQSFDMADKAIQMVLGSYDASLGINSNQISGVAIQQGAMHSNAAAMPYIMGYIRGLNRMAEIIIDLIPKYYVTPRSIPIVTSEGKKDYEIINQNGSIYMNYDPKNMQIKVEAGTNFEVQKQLALEQTVKLMQVSPTFNQFINNYGLEMLLDNLDIRGIDELKQGAAQFMQQQQQQAQQAQQMAIKTNPAVLDYQARMAAIKQKEEQAQMEQMSVSEKTAVSQREADIDFIKLMSEIKNEQVNKEIQREKIDAENARTIISIGTDLAKHSSQKMIMAGKNVENVQEEI